MRLGLDAVLAGGRGAEATARPDCTGKGQITGGTGLSWGLKAGQRASGASNSSMLRLLVVRALENTGASGRVPAGTPLPRRTSHCHDGFVIVKRESVVKSKVGRRELKKAETAQRIAVAGRKLIRAKGFDAVTTQEVAVEAGIPPGTLFGYISNKTDLLIIALVHEAMEFVATIPGRVPATGSCKDRVMFVFEEMANYHGRDIKITRHFLRELAITLNPELTERSHGLGDAERDLTSAIVAEHQKRGEVTQELSASDISRLLFSHYWSSLRYWVTGIYTREEYTTTLRKALRWQFMGIGATPAAAAGSPKERRR